MAKEREKFTWSITLEEVPGLGIRWPGYKVEIRLVNAGEEADEEEKVYSYEDTDRPLWAAAV